MLEATIRRAPKVLLHDHLDGGIRAATLLELVGASDRARTEQVIEARGRSVTSLEEYLTAFPIVTRVLQDRENLRRVAYEAGEDLRLDNVIYAEIRFAPELHLAAGLTMLDAIHAVAQGLEESGIRFGIIAAAMRDRPWSGAVAAAACAARDAGLPVVGFDLAGPEAGHPARDHQAALRLAAAGGLGLTIHAGEGAGPESVLDALRCGADRIGHGVRIAAPVRAHQVTDAAQQVRDQGIVLEICPSSNLHTGLYPTMAEHPLERLRRAGHLVTVNTDNRFVSNTTLSAELTAVAQTFHWGTTELREVIGNAARATFLPAAARDELVTEIHQGIDQLGPAHQ